MSLFQKIKQILLNGYLKLELKDHLRERKPNRFDFSQIKTVGILFDSTKTEDFELVKRYILYLREHHKRVKAIGFFTSKQIPEMAYSKLEYDFFSGKELNWFGKPSSISIQNFIDEEYDLLIDLNVHNLFPLKYISALSKASFKVGKLFKNDVEIFDLMIDSEDSKSLKYFLRQVDTYVTMLNKVEPNLN